jgi:hypothetical protein
MKRSSRPARRSAKLSNSLHRKLNMYALAATATGVSALALAQPAEAKIVYTPAHVKLLAGKPFPLDLNHDGIVDFYLEHVYRTESSSGANSLVACHGIFSFTNEPFCSGGLVNPLNAIRVVESRNKSWGAALPYGAILQRGDAFVEKQPISLGEVVPVTNPRWYGPWINGGKGRKNRYLGMRFQINGRFHYGWARMTVTTTSNTFTPTLTGYAYETIPGKGIVAGKTKGSDVVVAPATLGHLAGGANAISGWRVNQAGAHNVQ